MGALVNAAKFATDTAAGGFRDQALVALVNKARGLIATPSNDVAEMSFARAVIKNPPIFEELAAWVAATDGTVSGATTPTEAQINSAIVVAWPYLWQLVNA